MKQTFRFASEHRLTLSLIVYQVIISTRIFIEMKYLTAHIFIHQLFWFTGVLLWFVLIFKQVLKVEENRLWFFSAGSLLTFIPLIYATLMGEEWRLNYVAPESFFQVVKEMATLLAFHPKNWPMFPELVLLLIFTYMAGIYLTKNFKTSLAATILSVYGSFVLFGFSWISVAENHPSAFFLKSTFFDPQKFYSLQMIAMCSVIIILTFKKDILKFMSENNIKPAHNFFVFIPVFVLIMGFHTVLISKGEIPSIADVAICTPPIFLLSSSIYLSIKTKKLKPFIIPIYFSIFLFTALFAKTAV